MSLKWKILLRTYSLIFLIIFAMSITYYYLFTKDVRERSQQNVAIAFRLIADDLQARMQNVRSKIDRFTQTALSNQLYMIEMVQRTQQAEQAVSVWDVKKVMTYLSAIAARVQEFGTLSEAAEILVYGHSRRLLVMYRYTEKTPKTGVYLPDVDARVLVPLQPDDRWYAMLQSLAEIPRRPLPEDLPLVYADAMPETARVAFSRLGALVTIQLTTPITERGNVQGVCVIRLALRQSDVARYARLSGTEVNIFAGSALSVGTLPAYNFLPQEFTKRHQNLDFLTLPTLPPTEFSDLNVRGQSYYQGTLALGDQDRLIGAITVAFPRRLEEQQERNFFLVIAGIAFVFSLVAAGEAIGLSTLIVRPISHLMTVMQAMKSGSLDVTAPIETNDEIGQLAETFNLMTAQLKQSFARIAEEHRQVERQNQELQRLDKLKDEFLSNTSHELRTPLNGIAGLAEALLNGADGPLNDQERRHVRMILQSSKRLAGLVNEILDFSRIKADKLHFHIKSFPLGAVADVVCAFSRTLLHDKPVELRLEIPADLPEVLGDLDRVEQILTNLVGNAIKFTPQGAITIAARLAGDVVRVSVQDTGIGIPAEAFERIFHPFEQVDGSATREFGGTGLGLAITQELVARQGGQIWVESEVGQGSTFHFTLPCAEKTAQGLEVRPVSRIDRALTGNPTPAPSQADRGLTGNPTPAPSQADRGLTGRPTPAPSQEGIAGMPPVSGEGRTILIIEDDPTNVEVLQTQLTHAGFTVIAAANGKAAFELINGDQIDLILCDVMMPLVDGYTFAMRVREHERLRNIPLIFVSAKDQPQDKLKGYQAGGVDYLTKPVAQEELLLKVNAILNLQQRMQDRFLQPGALHTHDLVYDVQHDQEPQYAAIRQGNRERILVVDDEPINLEVFKTHLAQYNYDVLTASNGLEALEHINHRSPDLVLLDLMMPKMSGFRVCQIIRRERQRWDLPVIMLTAKSNIYDKVYGLNLGANDYLLKPFHVEELLTRIAVLLSIAALQKELLRKNETLHTEIVERIQAEDALRQLNAELEQRVEERTWELQASLDALKQTQMHLVQSEKMAALGGLVAGIAHEINTPVGVGITAASYLKDETEAVQHLYRASQMKQTDLERYLDITGKSSALILSNFQRIARQIQTFKQAAVDQTTAGKRRFFIKSYLEDTLYTLPPEVRQAGHQMTVTGDENLLIESYPGALSQVITSLIINSVDHAYHAGERGHLHIELQRQQDRVLIRYGDNGCGILPEHVNKIFDPFFTTTRGMGGTGLGLHIVYNLVTQKLKGRIHCESQMGVGTTFQLSLPLVVTDANNNAAELPRQ